MTPLHQLSQFVSEAPIQVGDGTKSIVRHALIDTLGCIFLGALQPVSQKTQRSLAVWGTGGAAVYGTKYHLPAPWAAMANGVAGHALDFDDWEIPGNTHCSNVLFPALLAVAESETASFSGQAILEAYIAGFEVIARIGEAVNFDHYARGWHATATLGALGAAAAVARLKGLDTIACQHAMSIAFSHATGYTCQFGSDAKALQAGFAAQAGVMSAYLAQEGLTGQADILEHPKGFNALLAHGDEARFWRAFNQEDQELAIKKYGLVIKPYPTCGYTHRVIDCALAIKQDHFFPLNEIDSINASITDFHLAILPFTQPQLRPEALFSAPFCIANALADGKLDVANLESETWQKAEIQELISKVTLHARPQLNPELNYDPADPDWLEVNLTDGRTFRAEVAYPLGTPENPMTPDQIFDKFIKNGHRLADPNALLDRLKRWDQLEDIGTLIKTF